MKKCKETYPGLPDPVFHPAGGAAPGPGSLPGSLPRPGPLPPLPGLPGLSRARWRWAGPLAGPLARWWPLARWLLFAVAVAVTLAVAVFFLAKAAGSGSGAPDSQVSSQNDVNKEPPTGDWGTADEMPAGHQDGDDGDADGDIGDDGDDDDQNGRRGGVPNIAEPPGETPAAPAAPAAPGSSSTSPAPSPPPSAAAPVANSSSATVDAGAVSQAAVNQSQAASKPDDEEELVYDTDELVIEGDDGDAEYEGDTEQTLPEFLESILSLWSSSPAPPRVLNGHRYGDTQAGDQWPVASSPTPSPSPSTRPPVPVVSPTLPPRLSLVHRVTPSPTPSPEAPADDDCESPRLPLCRGLLPYDLTLARPSVPQVPALRTAADLSAALPYFELVAQSGCSARVRAFLCPLLEPECVLKTASPRRPCRRLCRAVAEDCQDFILNNLDLSRVFDCSHYPDAAHGEQCLDLSAHTGCLPREFSCGDGSCIPQRWLCDGRPDCAAGADERNCTNVCPDDHFRCASSARAGAGPAGVRCVRALLRCDGRQDCADGSDEVGCAANTGGADAVPAINATLVRV